LEDRDEAKSALLNPRQSLSHLRSFCRFRGGQAMPLWQIASPVGVKL